MLYLHHIIPIKHQVCICLMFLQIPSIRNQEPEVGLQKLVPVVGHGFGSTPAGPPSPPALIIASASPTVIVI